MKTLLTADLHLGHENIIRYCNRPFSSADDMKDQLIKNWNAVAGPNDIVWCLGDVGRLPYEEMLEIFNELNGKKKLVIGNHDVDRKGRLIQSLARLPWANEPSHLARIKHDGVHIVLSHYAGLTWDASHHGSLMAFGHSHGTLRPLPGSIDVGVDCQGYRPITVEEFIEQAKTSFRNAREVAEAAIDQIRDTIPLYEERLTKLDRPK